VNDPDAASARIGAEKERLLSIAGQAVPGLVKRGGGPRDIEVRRIGPGHLVVHLLVQCCDAMGANLVNTAAEYLGPELARLCQADLGLCILSNLSDRRMVEVTGTVPVSDEMTEEVARAIERASVFAERDPYRAATHNKGIMNGIDSVVLATGNDYRAVEAGAHAYAASAGSYSPLATWRVEKSGLVGKLKIPLAVGTVGGTLRVHPGARAALSIAQVKGADDLACLAACAGLASNLAALRALSTDGIQKGHMALHARAVATAAGALGEEVQTVAEIIAEAKNVTKAAAEGALARLRKGSP
jgi:hydroxymethylglutaryl-CoA reductase